MKTKHPRWSLLGGATAAFFLLGLCLPNLVGCAFLQKTLGWVVSRPQVQVRHIAVRKASLDGVQFEVGLAIHNPNQFDLTFADLKYQLYIDESLLAEGAHAAQLSIPSDGSANVALPISVDINRSFAILKKLIGKKNSANAEWKGTASFVTPVGNLEVALADKRPLS